MVTGSTRVAVGLRPNRSAASVARIPSSGSSHDPHPAPPWQRLMGEQLGDVEHLIQRLDLDDPGLVEQRVDGSREAEDVRTACPTGTPTWVRPLLTATIGLVWPTRRAIRENLRGFPMDSK